MRTMIALSVSLMLSLVACGGGGGGGPEDTAASLTAEGWELFEQGKYAEAIEKFNDALALDDTYADAYNGLGWSNAKLDELLDALTNFDLCIDNGMSDEPDPYAGKAVVYRDYDAASDHFSQAITAALTALEKDRRYVFSHYTSFDWKDLMIVLAQCYFALKDYTTANAWVDSLPDSHPADPQSETFVSDLSAEIERLESIYGD